MLMSGKGDELTWLCSTYPCSESDFERATKVKEILISETPKSLTAQEKTTNRL